MRRWGIGVTTMTVATALCVHTVAWGQVQNLNQTEPPPVELNFYGGGAKAAAMGGAFIGVADDASAGYWNPAGLTQNDRVFAGLQFRYGHHRVQNRLDSPEPLSTLYDTYSRENVSNFNFASFNSPIRVKGQRFYLSASWIRAQDLRFEGDYSLTDFTDFDLTPISLVEESLLTTYTLTEGGAKIATLAAATQLKEEVLSVGFAVNILLGKAYDSSRFFLDGTGLISGEYIRGIGDATDRRDFLGVNFGIGSLYQGENYSVGATVKTPFQLKTTHDGRSYSAVYHITPDSLLLESEVGVLYETETKVDIPLQVGVGFAYRPQENLLFAADYEYKAFGSSKTYAQDSILDPKSEFVESDPNWKDVHQFRVGMEYLTASRWGTIPLRAGFRIEPLPYRHRTNAVTTVEGVAAGNVEQYEDGDQIIGEVYTVGTGIQWTLVRLDLTYEYHSTKQYADGYYSNDDLKPLFIRMQDDRRHRLSLGFTGYF